MYGWNHVPGFGGKGKRRRKSKKEWRRKIDFHWKTMRLRVSSLHTAQHCFSSAHNSHTIARHGKTLNIILHSYNRFCWFSFQFQSDNSAKWIESNARCEYISQWKCNAPTTYNRASYLASLILTCVWPQNHTQFLCNAIGTNYVAIQRFGVSGNWHCPEADDQSFGRKRERETCTSWKRTKNHCQLRNDIGSSRDQTFNFFPFFLNFPSPKSERQTQTVLAVAFHVRAAEKASTTSMAWREHEVEFMKNAHTLNFDLKFMCAFFFLLSLPVHCSTFGWCMAKHGWLWPPAQWIPSSHSTADDRSSYLLAIDVTTNSFIFMHIPVVCSFIRSNSFDYCVSII